MSFLSNLFRREAPVERKREAGSRPTRPGMRQIMTAGDIIGAAKMTRLESSWASMPWTADAYIYNHWLTLVTRSRIGCEDYDHLRKFIALVRDNIVGAHGFRLTPLPLDPGGKIDREAGLAILRAWKEWSKPKNYDFNGRMSRADSERQAVTSAAKDGEAIALIHTGANAGPWGFSIELLDPALLDPRQYFPLQNGNILRHGIEFPAEGGRPVAYHFQEQDDQRFGYTWGMRQTKRILADRIIHWFIPEIVGQKRGLPWTRTGLWRLRMLSGFEDAALTNARVAASKMAFFTDPDGEEVETEDLPMDAEPGSFEDIGNRQVQTVDWQYPNNETESFTRSMLRPISAGLLTSYHSLTGDLTSVSFSSIRQGTLDERSCYTAIQDSMASGYETPIFEPWLEFSLLAGRITLPNGRPLPFEKIAKFRDAIFTGRRWQWIDPVAEANAAQIMIGQKLRSRSEIIRDIGDRDPEEVWDEIEQEDIALEERDIVPLVPPGSTPVLPPEAAGEDAPPPVDPNATPAAQPPPAKKKQRPALLKRKPKRAQ